MDGIACACAGTRSACQQPESIATTSPARRTSGAARATSRATTGEPKATGQTQFNYSEVFGAGMAAAISTYSYHPAGDKNFCTVVSVWGTQIGWDVGTYVLKEFWPDLRRRHHKSAADNQ